MGITETGVTVSLEKMAAVSRLGLVSRTFSLFWVFATILLSPISYVVWTGLVCVVIIKAVFRIPVRRILNWKVLFFVAILSIPLLFFGEASRHLYGIPISDTGLRMALRAAVRAVVIFYAVTGFVNRVDISKLAVVFERFGLNGLGFSIGVALNMLPALKRSTRTTWSALKMRGGLKYQKLNTLRLVVITIFANAISYAENVTLAAEARAFDPSKRTVSSNRLSWWDVWYMAALLALFLILFLLLPRVKIF